MIRQRTYFTMADCQINLNELMDESTEAGQLKQLIELRYEYNWIVFSDTIINYPAANPDEATPDPLKIKQWCDKFQYIFKNTAVRYELLIHLYEENQAKLLDKITTTSVSRFNDTPQSDGVYTDDKYNTNITTNTIESNGGQIIDRLENIKNKLNDLYSEWVYNFSSLFGESIL